MSAQPTPVMQQYTQLKKQYADAILLFRLGDFYETFFEDAKLCSKELDLVLTGRNWGDQRAPMCGVPWHAVDGYIARLINAGYRVALCEQMGEPGKGLIERDVVRVITPGTVVDPGMLRDKEHNWLVCLMLRGDAVGLCAADVSTGTLRVGRTHPARLCDDLAQFSPRELLINDDAFERVAKLKPALPVAPVARPSEAFAEETARGELALRLGPGEMALLEGDALAMGAAGALLDYLRQTQKNALSHMRTLEAWSGDGVLSLDGVARRNLELVASLRDGGRAGTLLATLDSTATAMGGRLLRDWISQPMSSVVAIKRRLSGVASLIGARLQADELSEHLGEVSDLERLCTKLSYQSFTARDALALSRSLGAVAPIKRLCEGLSPEIAELGAALNPLDSLRQEIDRAIAEDPPISLKEGGMLRDGYSEELDELRAASSGGKGWLAQLEANERETTGIRNLKVGYNRVFGYYIEIGKSGLDRVPYGYVRKQTVASGERFITPELKQMEQRILGAEDKAMRLEYALFAQLRDAIAQTLPAIQRTARALAALDATASLAAAALSRGYVRPDVHDGDELNIVAGRHPVVEAVMPGFVPNDTFMNRDERMVILTGPNMAGKSTYMRQVALIALMAHMGSYVPAQSARIPIMDRIFTRIGAQDDLASGRSTFMVEMSEVADILKSATARSLILLDEIGRGTATFDGLSIAWAVAEHVADAARLGAKTLFATHYHEMGALEQRVQGVVNYRVSVREVGEEVVFLRRIERGGADRSFGIHVAASAGLPSAVIARAKAMLRALEAGEQRNDSFAEAVPSAEEAALRALAGTLADLDVMSITPLEALNQLFTLKEKAKETLR